MELIDTFKKYHRLADYISAAQLYLKDNFLLERELKQTDIKTRVLGHWGTVPGINFIYGGLNHLVTEYDKSIMLIVGPGHGAPAIITNVFLEGTLGDVHPKYRLSKLGLERLIHDFSWPDGFDSHTSPHLPGSIHEGGELGYSLATAYGTVLGNPELITACIVGDGEAETATLAASWQCNKFINPVTDGAVLPILHLNGYKISAPTIFSTMSDNEIEKYFEGLGYQPFFVSQYDSEDVYIDYMQALHKAIKQIDSIKSGWSNYQTAVPTWPLIVLRTKKGWGGIDSFRDNKIEDNNLSHGIPLKTPHKDIEQFQALKQWLESYNVSELIDQEGMPLLEIQDFLAKPPKAIGANKFAYKSATKLNLPEVSDHELHFAEKGKRQESRMAELSQYLRDIFAQNKNFIMFSPDESESNMLETTFSTTSRKYLWPTRAHDEYFSPEGQIIEMLSENVLFAMMVGYITVGNHGILVSYEAFLNIVSSQIDQYIKFLRQREKEPFLQELPSLNLLATSTLWRQEHNGFSHQNPTLINSLLTKYHSRVRLFFPADANSLIYTTHEILKTTNTVNYITACKKDLPQWLTMKDAEAEFARGWGHWRDLDNIVDGAPHDTVLVSIGDYQTNENYLASRLLKKIAPELSFKFININQLSQQGLGNPSNPVDKTREFHTVFERDIDIIFNFHGYPTALQQLFYNTELSKRSKIFGYIEQGRTTTPLNMQLLNKTSRYHIAIEAIKSASRVNPKVEKQKNVLISQIEKMIQRQQNNIFAFSEDLVDDF